MNCRQYKYFRITTSYSQMKHFVFYLYIVTNGSRHDDICQRWSLSLMRCEANGMTGIPDDDRGSRCSLADHVMWLM